jgi:phosphatidylglycerol---prolipoprotein diacylglyceryl transferase
MQAFYYLAWLYWNPPREAFRVPWIDRPVMWYGVCFVLGFIIGYLLFIPILKRKLISIESKKLEACFAKSFENLHDLSIYLTDRLTWFIVFGMIIGARLGHVFFYDWPHYQHDIVGIVKVWEGGLASHGGTIGTLIAIYVYQKTLLNQLPEITFLSLIDILTIPSAFIAFCIRIGNFFNQEILGTVTTVPWAIIFGQPADGTVPIPRHPTQLYEALSYLGIFALLYFLWKTRGETLKPGTLSGLIFLLIFGMRFFIEFLKMPQSMLIDESYLQMGQYLSLPFIALGFYLLFLPQRLAVSKSQ